MFLKIAGAQSAKQSGISWGQRLLTPTSFLYINRQKTEGRLLRLIKTTAAFEDNF